MTFSLLKVLSLQTLFQNIVLWFFCGLTLMMVTEMLEEIRHSICCIQKRESCTLFQILTGFEIYYEFIVSCNILIIEGRRTMVSSFAFLIVYRPRGIKFAI